MSEVFECNICEPFVAQALQITGTVFQLRLEAAEANNCYKSRQASFYFNIFSKNLEVWNNLRIDWVRKGNTFASHQSALISLRSSGNSQIGHLLLCYLSPIHLQAYSWRYLDETQKITGISVSSDASITIVINSVLLSLSWKAIDQMFQSIKQTFLSGNLR